MADLTMKAKRSVTGLRLLAPLSTITGKVQILGLVILGCMIAAAVLAPLITDHGPRETVCESFQIPSIGHPLGCNDVGQDLLSRLIHGARVSLFVGILVAVLSTLIATVLALVAGYHASFDAIGDSKAASWTDKIIMRCVDVVLSLPFLPLVIVLGVFFGASIHTQILVITLVMWAHPVRELRAQVLSIRAADYVEAARSMGGGGFFIGLKHILPELAPLIVPQFVRIAHNAILVEASLAFLGLGDPLQNSWGSILFHANARAAFLTGAWTYWIVPPGLAIGLTVLSFAFIGYGFDASLGSRLRPGNRLKTESEPKPNPTGSFMALENLSVDYLGQAETVHAVRSVDLELTKGELVGLVGESGSGKTTLAMAVLQLLRQPASISSGSVRLEGRELLDLSPTAMRDLRRKRLALIPQSAMNALNPVLSIGNQIDEALELAGESGRAERKKKAAGWMGKVGLKPSNLGSYPHELSGGMRQRAVIAIALCKRPDFVIADEPTTGLDVLLQEEIMQLLLDLQRDLGLTILFVTHNLPLIARHCTRLAVMLDGRIVDVGAADRLRSNPGHPHTKALFDSVPELAGSKRWQRSLSSDPRPVLELKSVSKIFAKQGWLSGKQPVFKAVDNVSLCLEAGGALGLVGGSGAGKSTIARLITGMLDADSGRVVYQGRDGQDLTSQERRAMRKHVHLVFQDPYQSLHNRMTIFELVAEPLRIHGDDDAAELVPRVRAALEAVQMPTDDDFLMRLPVSLSGGQRQRVAFARAVITEPKIIIADEPTSMLDQSIRMGVMDLMEDLRRNLGTGFLFITHDIVLARHFCDRLVVLKDGKVVEEGDADRVALQPRHPYTQALIAAVEENAEIPRESFERLAAE